MSDFIYGDDEQDHRGWRSDPFEDQPIEVPLGDITDAPRQCVEISLDWVPVIISALERLKFGDMWLGTEADVERAANNIDTLQVMLADGQCDGGNMDYTCYEIPLHSPIINWLPADPFENDPPLPHGYTMAPWKVSPFDDPVNGIQIGDVIVNPITALTSFPPIIPTSGVPRMQITVTGPAEIDIEFARVFQGGIALILVDGVPRHYVDCQLFNVADILNVTSWLELFGFAVGTFTRAPLEMPIELPDAQEYIIEVQMFPRPALDYSLGYGGGIRGISICSEQEQIDMSPFVTDIRINNGTVEKEVDSVWSVVAQPDTDDVLTESDLRGQGCGLQYYDLETSSWIKVPGADFYNTLVNCDIEHSVRVNLGGDGTGFDHRDGADVSQYTEAISAGHVSLWGKIGIGLLTGGGSWMGWWSDNRFMWRDSGASPEYDALISIRANSNIMPMSVHAANAGPANIMHWRNSSDQIVAELAQVGWFSALQQFIVNDHTSTAAKRAQGRLLGQWADDTDATRKGRTILQADDFNGVREGLRIEADGAAAMLGFYGAAAVANQTVTGGTAKAALESLLSAVENLGLIDDQTNIVAGGEGIVPEKYFEIVDDYSLDWGLILPQNFSAPNLWGDFVNEQGFVSEPDAGTPEHMRLRVNMAVGDFEEILRIRLTYLIADGAVGDFNHDMVHPSSGVIVAIPGGQYTANGPETKVFDMYQIGFRWTSAQVIRFSYSDIDAEAAHIVTLQKIEVMGVGRPLFRNYAISSDVDIFEETIPDWST